MSDIAAPKLNAKEDLDGKGADGGRLGGNQKVDEVAQRLLGEAQDSDFMIVTDQGKKYSFGSGFFVDKSGYAVTAYHVIQDSRAIMGFPNREAPSVKLDTDKDLENFIKREGKAINFDVVATDKQNDLAVLKAKVLPREIKPLELTETLGLQSYDPVVAIGHPNAVFPATQRTGTFLRHEDMGEQQRFQLRTDSFVTHGNSGGALLNLDGKVLGVAVQRSKESGYFAPSEKIAALLGKADPKFEVQRKADGLAGYTVDAMLKDSSMMAFGITGLGAYAGLGTLGFRLGSHFPRTFGTGLMAEGAAMGVYDFSRLRSARNESEMAKYAVATGADLGMIATGIKMFEKASFKTTAIMFGLSYGARFAAEFWPVRTSLTVRD